LPNSSFPHQPVHWALSSPGRRLSGERTTNACYERRR
jgi:hypothetical protein